jgi:hypothetical protein
MHDEDRDGLSIWPLVLADWFNASARVTITTRAGVQFTGDIERHPSEETPSGVITLSDRTPRVQSKHTVALSEIAAITAAK